MLIKVLTKHLRKKGVNASVLTWRNSGQSKIETIDGTHIYSYPYIQSGSVFGSLFSYASSIPLYKYVDADVYHHIDARIETLLAKKLAPGSGHLIHFQDPYDEYDFKLMSSVDSSYHLGNSLRAKLWLNYSLLHSVCEPPTRLYTHARYLRPKIKKLFRLGSEIGFLPNPVEIPSGRIKKASEPTFCFLGRSDPQKRIHLFFEIAKKFPSIKFIAMGKGKDPKVETALLRKFSNIKNLEFWGLVSDEKKSEVLGRSWGLINTSVREALPISFLEAFAHGTCVLSCVNPDDLTNRFGIYVNNGDFVLGLKKLLRNDLWKTKGSEAHNYAKEIHDVSKIIDTYIDNYKEILEGNT